MKEVIKFAKVRESAVIPSKRKEDAGYDIYACFNENYMMIEPHKTVMIPTGIASAFSEDYVMVLKERGSNGVKGIAQRAGVIDSNYRGEWMIPLTNTTDKTLVFSNWSLQMLSEEYYGFNGKDEDFIIYPESKAICQALLLPVPKTEIQEIPYVELQAIESNRGDGMLGSSGK